MKTPSNLIHLVAIALAGMATLLLSACSPREENSENLYDLIDKELENRQQYTAEKDKRIERLKNEIKSEDDEMHRLHIYDNLIEEYQAYVCDSALKYVEEAQDIARLANSDRAVMRLELKKADIASHAGLFTQAHNILEEIDPAKLDTMLRTDYYTTYCNLCYYESEYLPEGIYTAKSRDLRRQYTDSLLRVSSPDSFAYLTNWADQELRTDPERVRQRLEKELEKYELGSRRFSILASIMARVYHAMDNREKEKEYLALTVLSDVKGAIKENIAMRELATRVFEDGDLERANLYMTVSLDDAQFFAASMNSAQSGRMLPVINKAYKMRQKEEGSQQRVLIYITSVLLVIATTGMVVIFRQMSNNKRANLLVQKSNDELSAMSRQLKQTNTALANTNNALARSNKELRVSNRTAEEYAGLFMNFCSLTISNLERYHMSLRNLALQGNVKGILKKLDKSDVSTETLRTFYQQFDDAILNLYPRFVDHVNALMRPGCETVLKNGEKLNTELRVLALIKIGINDSERMADFLRCSISTIYTYRSRLKRRAKDPEKFEQQLMEM